MHEELSCKKILQVFLSHRNLSQLDQQDILYMQPTSNPHLRYEGHKGSTEGKATLEEPHGNDVVCQRDNVVVEFEGIGVWNSNGKDRHVLL